MDSVPLCQALHHLVSVTKERGDFYKSTNIIGERVVNYYQTRLNDALIESWTADFV